MAALVALTLPVLLVATALVIDVAYAFGVRAWMQSAADMASLAAAQNLDLEALADGDRHLIRRAAEADARSWTVANLEGHPWTAAISEGDIDVQVYNATPDAPARHRYSGRELKDPTVSVRIALEVPTLFLRTFTDSFTITVMADASVLEKADPLPYD